MDEDEELEEVVDEGANSKGGMASKLKNAFRGMNNKRKATKAAKAAKVAGGASKAASGTAFFASPVGWIILIVIIVIIVLGGIIGFFTVMPGLYKDKVVRFVAKSLDNLFNTKSVEANTMLNNTKKFVSDLGYDLVGFGFVKELDNAIPKKENDDGTVEYKKDEYDKYLSSYLIAELNTYSFETTEGSFKDIFAGVIGSISPGRYRNSYCKSWFGRFRLFVVGR